MLLHVKSAQWKSTQSWNVLGPAIWQQKRSFLVRFSSIKLVFSLSFCSLPPFSLSRFHYGLELPNFPALIIHCPTSSGVSEQMNSSGARKRSKQCKASKLVSRTNNCAKGRANSPLLTSRFFVVLNHSGFRILSHSGTVSFGISPVNCEISFNSSFFISIFFFATLFTLLHFYLL